MGFCSDSQKAAISVGWLHSHLVSRSLSKLNQNVGRIPFLVGHWLRVTLRSSLPFSGPRHVASPSLSSGGCLGCRISPRFIPLSPEWVQVLIRSLLWGQSPFPHLDYTTQHPQGHPRLLKIVLSVQWVFPNRIGNFTVRNHFSNIERKI